MSLRRYAIAALRHPPTAVMTCALAVASFAAAERYPKGGMLVAILIAGVIWRVSLYRKKR